MCPPKESSAVALHTVPRTKTPERLNAAAPVKHVGRKQRLRIASEKMNQLDSDLKDTVAGLKKGVVDFSDFDPD
jgi:hypothetical protein